jgi:hypothetical protein
MVFFWPEKKKTPTTGFIGEISAADQKKHLPPRAKPRRNIEDPVFLGYQRVKHVCEELHDRWTLRIVGGKHEAELQNAIRVITWTERYAKIGRDEGSACAITLMNKKHSIPHKQVIL